METQKIEIPWNDGSGENLTLTVQENDSGEVDIKITSPQSLGLKRTKLISLSSSEHDSIVLEFSQKDINPAVNEGEVDISFMMR